MSDLTEFLLARIAEDEAVARDAVEYEDNVWETAGWIRPSRVLAECEAKRRIVGLHPEMLERCQGDGEAFPCRTLLTLALSYADHPDYRDEWRP